MTDTDIIEAERPTRDALIIYALLGRLGRKCTKNEVMEAVSSSAVENPLGWAADAISGFGFLCNSGNVKISAITSSILPALALGKNGQLIILEEIQEDRFSIYDSQNTGKKHLTKKEFEEYKKIQAEGKYNMLSPEAMKMSTLDKNKWYQCIKNYNKLNAKYS